MRTTRSVTVGRTADIKPGELAAFDVEGVRIAVANAEGATSRSTTRVRMSSARLPRTGRWRGPW